MRLTETQIKYMLFINAHIEACDNFPLVRDMAAHFGVNTNASNSVKNALEKKGMLERVPGSRALKRTQAFKQVLAERQGAAA